MQRIQKDPMYMEIAYLLSQRSRCNRLRVGAVLVVGKSIVGSGCNGPILGDSKIDTCDCNPDVSCGATDSIHAEMNAILEAIPSIKGDDSTLYITHSPCFGCARLIHKVGITEVVYSEAYRDVTPIKYLEKNDIKVRQYTGEL